MHLDILRIALDHLKLLEITKNCLNYFIDNKFDIFPENKITIFQKFFNLFFFTII